MCYKLCREGFPMREKEKAPAGLWEHIPFSKPCRFYGFNTSIKKNKV